MQESLNILPQQISYFSDCRLLKFPPHFIVMRVETLAMTESFYHLFIAFKRILLCSFENKGFYYYSELVRIQATFRIPATSNIVLTKESHLYCIQYNINVYSITTFLPSLPPFLSFSLSLFFFSASENRGGPGRVGPCLNPALSVVK